MPLFDTHPELEQLWDHEKNTEQNPADFGPNSRTRVFWRCTQGHSWESSVYSVAIMHTRCPYCLGKKPIPGETDLETKRPDLAAQWDYERNDRPPNQVSPSSAYRAHWVCENGHTWEMPVHARNYSNSDCPYCSGLKAWAGDNDLATKYPEIASEWCQELNGALTPSMITPHSAKKVWWECEKGHRWDTRVYNRTKGCGCPYCSGKRTIPSVNDLATVHPELTSEWDYEKNGNLQPNMFLPNSHKKVHWKCKRNHSWEAAIQNRVRGCGCPYCASKLPIPGENDLETCFPAVAAEWDYEANFPLTPKDVLPGADRRVGWKCLQGHTWTAKVCKRAREGSNCPYCSGFKVWTGFNDLATKKPDLALEWDYERNGDLTPEQVSEHSHTKVFWKCRECGGSWRIAVGQRVSYGTGCPMCKNAKKLSKRIL